ncbi:hypothetical protein BH11PSE12_BH11PSE12_27210 [soil metagenome]
MASVGIGYVVQELESAMFLCAEDGDVGFTPFLHQADSFDCLEAAVDTAMIVVGSNFKVTQVVRKEKPNHG